jgi:hypothetical protein
MAGAIPVSGKITTCTAVAFIRGRTAGNTMGNTSRTKSMAMAFTLGLTDAHTTAAGVMDVSTVKESTASPTEPSAVGYGWRAVEIAG